MDLFPSCTDIEESVFHVKKKLLRKEWGTRTLKLASDKEITKLWAGLRWFGEWSVGLIREHGNVISKSVNNLKPSGKYTYRKM
jgi:hypothetical protein